MKLALRRGRVAVVSVVFALAWSGCTTVKREPPNIYPLKQRLRAYMEQGDYERDVAVVAARAKSWIDERAAKGGRKLTVVFDLDDTLLSSWPLVRSLDFGFVLPEWNRWVEEARAPAIESVREIYGLARRHGIDVVFITGRTEDTRAATERNLRAIDCADFVALICRPSGGTGTTASYKTDARATLIAEGRSVIANIGDQQSDLVGGHAERTFKLPNPLYLTE